MKSRYWILVIVAILLPLGLNWLILQPELFKTVGNGVVWLNFWPVYISSIATIAMVVATFYTLKQNREQLLELKKQWNDQNKAKLVFSVEQIHCFYCLKIHNIGKTAACNI